MRNILIIGFLLVQFSMKAQNKEDYVWLFSNNTEATPGNEAYGFDFNTGEEILPLQGVLPIRFSDLNASISDGNGNLLFYSNGCHVIGADHKALPNGYNLSEGDYFGMMYDTCIVYPGFQDILLLPDPGNEDGFYLINKIITEIPDVERFREMRYSYIDKNLNGGLGDVTEKNVKISDDYMLMYNYLSAIRHANGQDWWIIQTTKEEEGYLTFLLDEEGFSEPFLQTIGTPFHFKASASGTTTFSPDGMKYAYFNVDDDLLLFDFDRESGSVSNLRRADVVSEGLPTGFFSSVEFSPNSRFLYIAAHDSLYQVDTHEENLNDGIELIDVWDGTSDPFATVFHLMALAPNCKIYMTPSSSSNSYHVINKPNEKGTACDFVQRGIQLPYTSSIANLPNFPKFRVDEEEKCDPTIGSVFGEEVYYRRDLSLFPNPAKTNISIEFPEGMQGRLYVFDMNGLLVLEYETVSNQINHDLSISHLPAGTYSIEFIPNDQSEKLIWTNKLVVVK